MVHLRCENRGCPPSNALAIFMLILSRGMEYTSPAYADVEPIPEPAFKPEETNARASARPVDPDPGRMVTGTTGFMRPKGTGAWTMFDVGWHQFDFAVSSNLEVGIGALIPSVAFAVMPRIRLAKELAPRVHASIHASVTMAGLLVDDLLMFSFGFGAALSFGSPDAYFNIESRYWLLGTGNPMGELGSDTVLLKHVLIPTFGGGLRLSDHTKLHLEVGPALGNFGDHFDVAFVQISYGVRFFADGIFGDLAFVIPASEPWVDYPFPLFPIGFPMLHFGLEL